MKVRAYTDTLLRVLMHAALRAPERATVDEVAQTYGISRHLLVKVVHKLGCSGFLVTSRGVGGGFTLACPAETIRLGDIVRLGEQDEGVIDCVDRDNRGCRLFPACRLKGVFAEAASAFFTVLDGYTLADLLKKPSKMKAVLGL